MATYLELFKKIQKMNLQFVLKKNSLQALVELEFEMLGVVGKLVKNVVHLSKRIFFSKTILFSHGVQIANNQSLVSKDFRVK
jgi:hypothetical protein